jgi:hypothetical protein
MALGWFGKILNGSDPDLVAAGYSGVIDAD